MGVNFLERNKELDEDGDRKRSITLYCHVMGTDCDYVDSRTPSNAKYSINVHEDSIGTGLRNLYRVSLVAIEQGLIDADDLEANGLDDVFLISDLNEQDTKKGELDVNKSAEQVREYLAKRLFELQIGEKLNLLFNDVEVEIGIVRL
jgi:hypothetical protein